MCFTEFIGYTCGHSSVDVLRPCPMTTRFHTNPLCTNHGRRPVLAEGMCPACQRILHGRAVMILEWEHHWMHERGVCGCDVVFPDLIRPRDVNSGQPSASQQSDSSQSHESKEAAKGKSKKRKARGWGRSKNKEASPKDEGGKNGAGLLKKVVADPRNTSSGTAPPVEQQSNKAPCGSQGMSHDDSKASGVSVQIPSFYGVEWVEAHRQLHNSGSCKCKGDFSFYQTPESYMASTYSENAGEQAVHPAQSHPLGGGQGYEQSSGSGYMNQYHNYSVLCVQDTYTSQELYLGGWGQGPSSQVRPHEYLAWYHDNQPGNQYQSQHYVSGFLYPHKSSSFSNHLQQTAHNSQGIQTWAFPHNQLVCLPLFSHLHPKHPHLLVLPLQHNANPPVQQHHPSSNTAGAGLPVRAAGAIHHIDPTRSTNPLYNYACTEGANGTRLLDLQPVDYCKPADAPLPLVGLPIGAGPEGASLFSHVGPFRDCVLSLRGRRASEAVVAALLDEAADDTRETRLGRLQRNSKSVACLAELRRERNPEGERYGWRIGSAGSEVDFGDGKEDGEEDAWFSPDGGEETAYWQ